MKKRLFFTIFALNIFLSNAQAQAGSVELVITGLNGEPISPTTSIELIPSNYINIDVIYTSEPNYYLLSIDAVASAEGAGSGWFDISQVTWPEGYWDIYNYIYIDVNGDLVLNTFDSNDIYIPSDETVLSNILFHYTGLGSIDIGLADDPNDSGTQDTREMDNQSNFYIIDDFGTGIHITNPDRWPTDFDISDLPDDISENTQQQYNAIVSYNNGDTSNVTAHPNTNWMAEPFELADVDAGLVTTYSVIYPEELLTLYADYTEGNITVDDTVDIIVWTDLSIPELIKRNIDRAKELKQTARDNLLSARQMESASFTILGDLLRAVDFSDFNLIQIYHSRYWIFYAILYEYYIDIFIGFSVDKLNDAQAALDNDPNSQ